MKTIKLNAANNDIIRFDGDVVEVYDHMFTHFCRRLHCTLLDVIQVTTDRKGHSKLMMKGIQGYVFLAEIDIDDVAVEKVQALIAEIKSAKETFKFD